MAATSHTSRACGSARASAIGPRCTASVGDSSLKSLMTWSVAPSGSAIARNFPSPAHSALSPPSASHTSRQRYVFPSPAVPVSTTESGRAARKLETSSSRSPPLSKRSARTLLRFAQLAVCSSYWFSLVATGPYCRRNRTQLFFLYPSTRPPLSTARR